MQSARSAAEGSALRFVLIGCAAGIAPSHIAAMQATPRMQIVGMSDIAVERGGQRAADAGCPFFADYRAMLEAQRPDVAVICTPHPLHAEMTLAALEAGAHVLVEKPLAVTVDQADRMIAAARAYERLIAVSFQQRFRPVIERARALVDAGQIGPLVRVLSIEPWFRTAAYYRSAPWRGSWRGEGGGVLMNQAPHTLDLLCHLAGMPASVWGWTRTLCHAIECEDTAQAMLEYPNGAPGYIMVSTVEAGALHRLELVGEHGALEIHGDRLTLHRFSPSARQHMAECQGPFEAPQVAVESFDLPGDGGGHLAVYRDLCSAISQGTPLRCDASEALMSLELANAIIYSSASGQPVRLPLDREAYATLLAQRQAEAPAG